MTRDEAIEKVRKANPETHGGFEYLVDSLAELGLLKLDTPKTVEQQAVELLGHYGGHIVDALHAAGFKIVKA